MAADIFPYQSNGTAVPKRRSVHRPCRLVVMLERPQRAHRCQDVEGAKSTPADDARRRRASLFQAFNSAQAAADRPDHCSSPGGKAITMGVVEPDPQLATELELDDV